MQPIRSWTSSSTLAEPDTLPAPSWAYLITQQGQSEKAETLATELKVDPALLFACSGRQAAIGLLEEDASQGLCSPPKVTPAIGPSAVTELHGGWRRLALRPMEALMAMIRDGKQNAFVREFGRMAFSYALENQDYAERFKHAMSSYSAVQSALALEALRGYDFSGIRTFGDVAGGHGHLMWRFCSYPQLTGIVLDLPEVVGDTQSLWALKLGLQDRCRYVGGDMFQEVPSADAYSLKMILHDWNDSECVEILSNVRRAASGRAHVFIIEHVVPSHDVAYSKHSTST
jgi:hypothetical protein